MKTMTIHALDPEVEKRIRLKSRKEKKSLNQTLKELLAESVGASKSLHSDHRSEFSEFFGIWSEEDQAEFDVATTDLQQVDEEDWK